MPTQPIIETIGIKPGVSVLSVLRHLNYRPWFALAEFVDNSVQSFLANRKALSTSRGSMATLRVEIEMDPAEDGKIVVRDNAAGIAASDYVRAFRPAEVPANRSGLSEYGMGMKSAACWFSRRWEVRTCALGEGVERTVRFDIEDIVRDRLEELRVASVPMKRSDHYTEVTLTSLHKSPQTKTIGKIKQHLGSIYRVFLRDGSLTLLFNGEPISYHDPEVLSAPRFTTLDAKPLLWRKDINFDFGNGLSARGFAALRATASTSDAGFALFRRNRLIQGSADDGYRPELIFKKSNSYTFQRLFGELHLEGFDVSHTKDGFRWDENEEPFLALLRDYLDEEPLPLLNQAEGHRVRRAQSVVVAEAEAAAGRTANAVESHVPPVLAAEIAKGPQVQPLPESLPPAPMIARRSMPIVIGGQSWIIDMELTSDPAVGDWLTVSDRSAGGGQGDASRHLEVRLALAHPFMDRFCGADPETLEALLRVAVALGLGEIAARDVGVPRAGTIRRNVNELLRNALSNP